MGSPAGSKPGNRGVWVLVGWCPGQAESTKARVCFVILPLSKKDQFCSERTNKKNQQLGWGRFTRLTGPAGATEHYSNTKKTRPTVPRNYHRKEQNSHC